MISRQFFFKTKTKFEETVSLTNFYMRFEFHKIKQNQKKYAIVNLTNFYVRFEFFKAKQNRRKIRKLSIWRILKKSNLSFFCRISSDWANFVNWVCRTMKFKTCLRISKTLETLWNWTSPETVRIEIPKVSSEMLSPLVFWGFSFSVVKQKARDKKGFEREEQSSCWSY